MDSIDVPSALAERIGPANESLANFKQKYYDAEICRVVLRAYCRLQSWRLACGVPIADLGFR